MFPIVRVVRGDANGASQLVDGRRERIAGEGAVALGRDVARGRRAFGGVKRCGDDARLWS